MPRKQSSHVPVTSKSVLTVREQANLLQAFKSMRDIALKRAFPCPFDGCKYSFDPCRLEDAQTHIEHVHVSKKCIWCDETHFEWWNETQRQRHLRQKHRDKLLATLGVTDPKILSSNGTETVAIALTQNGGLADEVATGNTDSAAACHLDDFFCDCCGRDKRTFTCIYEKDYHETICRGEKASANDGVFCVECGDCDNTQGQGRACGHQPSGTSGQFCILCGIDTDRFSHYADMHRSSCRGQGSSTRPFCPHCGDRLWSNDDTSDHQALISAHRAQCNPTPKIQVIVKSLDQPPPAKPRPLPLEPSPASSEDYWPDVAASDSDSERGRPRKRQKKVAARNRKKAARGPERRPASPDWNVVLGEPDPTFVPDNKYYCSKCLRRVPKANRRRNAKQAPGTEEDYKVNKNGNLFVLNNLLTFSQHHTAGDRCCRIRNGIGSVENLPNRSGWIPVSKIPKLGVLKSQFLDVHPDYKATLYPLLPSDARNNMWRSDPNNESNRANWSLPWPPYMGRLPAIPEEETGDADESDDASSMGSSFAPDGVDAGHNAKKAGRGKKRRRADDGSYAYETGADSDDGMTGTDDYDGDGGGDDANPNTKKRRRVVGDATYRPRTGDESDSDMELERLRKVREEMEQEVLSMREQVQAVAPAMEEGPDSFIAD